MAAQAGVLAGGSVGPAVPLLDAGAMVAFGLGTVPPLSVAAVGLRHLTAGTLVARRVLALTALIFGLGAHGMRSDPNQRRPRDVAAHRRGAVDIDD